MQPPPPPPPPPPPSPPTHLRSLCRGVRRCLSADIVADMRVVIVGGGLGGLALANLLCKNDGSDNIEVTVLERDRDPTAREQGLAIGLAQGGVDVIQRAGVDLAKVRSATRAVSSHQPAHAAVHALLDLLCVCVIHHGLCISSACALAVPIGRYTHTPHSSAHAPINLPLSHLTDSAIRCCNPWTAGSESATSP
jgi:hypothetical protein